jgi:hypothetical protein
MLQFPKININTNKEHLASLNAAGVAALIRSYYPSLKSFTSKQIIMQSGTPIDLVVNVGENGETKKFSEACVSGKIVNAYNAFENGKKCRKN